MAIDKSTRARIQRDNSPNSRDFGPIHGMRNTPTYAAWKAMRQRCNDPNADNYKFYGGRGIRVCDRWSAFKNFFADMGEKTEGMTLERKDNDKNYEPGNVVWAPWSTQSVNKRNCTLVEAFGKRQTIAEWARETGMPASTISSRLRRGLSPETALVATTENNPHKFGHKRDILVTLNGQTMCLKDWARRLGVNYSTVCARIRRGIKPIDALGYETLREIEKGH